MFLIVPVLSGGPTRLNHIAVPTTHSLGQDVSEGIGIGIISAPAPHHHIDRTLRKRVQQSFHGLIYGTNFYLVLATRARYLPR